MDQTKVFIMIHNFCLESTKSLFGIQTTKQIILFIDTCLLSAINHPAKFVLTQ